VVHIHCLHDGASFDGWQPEMVGVVAEHWKPQHLGGRSPGGMTSKIIEAPRTGELHRRAAPSNRKCGSVVQPPTSPKSVFFAVN